METKNLLEDGAGEVGEACAGDVDEGKRDGEQRDGDVRGVRVHGDYVQLVVAHDEDEGENGRGAANKLAYIKRGRTVYPHDPGGKALQTTLMDRRPNPAVGVPLVPLKIGKLDGCPGLSSNAGHTAAAQTT